MRVNGLAGGGEVRLEVKVRKVLWVRAGGLRFLVIR